QALLALGAVGAQLPAAAQDRELVAVGPVSGEAALEVGLQALGELPYVSLEIARPRPRAVLERRPAGEPELARALGEGLRQQRDRLGAVVTHAQPCAGQLAVPRAQRGARGAAGADPCDQCVAL